MVERLLLKRKIDWELEDTKSSFGIERGDKHCLVAVDLWQNGDVQLVYWCEVKGYLLKSSNLTTRTDGSGK